ncbi:MAG TPA: putative Fe-S cluster assembly protein SufT [Terriglobales bacterium]|nr:putative Fe-S cluster assembly protein SufT [Terriglobales bacterium]
MHTGVPITLTRACDVIEIPSGIRGSLPQGTVVRILQTLGGSYTVSGGEYGYMYRIDARDADALGLSPAEAAAAEQRPFSEELVWDELKTVFDPEIPVNIVDLGLVYGCEISDLSDGGHRIDVKMSMTAPGCGMGNVLKADVESKLSRLPDVKQVNVEIVFDPPWTPALMSEAAKLQLGFDLDFGGPPSGLPVVR